MFISVGTSQDLEVEKIAVTEKVAKTARLHTLFGLHVSHLKS